MASRACCLFRLSVSPYGYFFSPPLQLSRPLSFCLFPQRQQTRHQRPEERRREREGGEPHAHTHTMAFRAVAPRPAGMQTPQRQLVGLKPAVNAAVGAAKGTPSKAAPSTPTVTDSPGNWRHPRMDEITRRRAATVFTETNLKTFVYNIVALVAVYLLGHASGVPFTQLRRLYVPLPLCSHILYILTNWPVATRSFLSSTAACWRLSSTQCSSSTWRARCCRFSASPTPFPTSH